MRKTKRARILAAFRAGIAGALLFSMGAASAGYVTENTTLLDTIFSQTGFANPIDIRFNAVQTVVDPSLTSIDTAGEVTALASLSGTSHGTVYMFFVDSINYCGSPDSNVIGCGNQPGNFIFLESSWAANATYGGILEAHELGHNLGLDHVSPDNGTNLMDPTISTSYTLTTTQISTIMSSHLIQIDGSGQRFISITPIAVMALIPEPQTWAMLSLGLLTIGGWVRRRKECTA